MSEMTNYESFYNLVKEWTLKDYCTQGIKAEVIFDMLLSPYVAEIVKRTVIKSGEKTCKGNFVLVAKEFPIGRKEKTSEESENIGTGENNSNDKVDYLVRGNVNGELRYYAVELKTSPGSFLPEQQENMIKRANDKDTFFKLFMNIITKETKHIYRHNYSVFPDGTDKYIGTLLSIAKLDDLDCFEKDSTEGEIREDIRKRTIKKKDSLKEALFGEPSEIKPFYLTLYSIAEDEKTNKDKVMYCSIPDLINWEFKPEESDKSDKNKAWDLFIEICKELTSKNGFEQYKECMGIEGEKEKKG